jgi:hypothetical protein
MVTVLNNKESLTRLSGDSSVLPGADVHVLVGRQPGGKPASALVLALDGDMYTTLLGRLVPGFSIPGLKLIETGATVGWACLPLFGSSLKSSF